MLITPKKKRIFFHLPIIRSPDIRTVSVIFYSNWSNVHQNFDISFECTLNLVINKLLLSDRRSWVINWCFKLFYLTLFKVLHLNLPQNRTPILILNRTRQEK
jgi:hypothetical protein